MERIDNNAPKERSITEESHLTSDMFTKQELIEMFCEERGLKRDDVDLEEDWS